MELVDHVAGDAPQETREALQILDLVQAFQRPQEDLLGRIVDLVRWQEQRGDEAAQGALVRLHQQGHRGRIAGPDSPPVTAAS